MHACCRVNYFKVTFCNIIIHSEKLSGLYFQNFSCEIIKKYCVCKLTDLLTT